MSTGSIGLSDSLHQYLVSVSVPPDPLWERLRDETKQTVGFNMQISPEQAQFMGFVLRMANVTKAIEIGTFTGYSALAIARALPTDGQLVACDVNTEWTSIAERYWIEAGVGNKIDLKIAPAVDTLETMITNGESGTYGFAFIDADKANYTNYYEACFELLYPGGIIAIDNTLWGGSVADLTKQDEDTQAIRHVNQRIFDDDRVDSTLIPIGDGLHLARKL